MTNDRIPLIGGQPETQATTAQKIARLTACQKALAHALAEAQSTGTIIISFFRDGSFSVGNIGALQIPHLVTAAHALNDQTSRAFQVALQQLQQRANAPASPLPT